MLLPNLKTKTFTWRLWRWYQSKQILLWGLCKHKWYCQSVLYLQIGHNTVFQTKLFLSKSLFVGWYHFKMTKRFSGGGEIHFSIQTWIAHLNLSSFAVSNFSLKHRKNCECCHHHSLFKGHNVTVNIVVLNCQKWNQCLKCQSSGHQSLKLPFGVFYKSHGHCHSQFGSGHVSLSLILFIFVVVFTSLMSHSCCVFSKVTVSKLVSQ